MLSSRLFMTGAKALRHAAVLAALAVPAVPGGAFAEPATPQVVTGPEISMLVRATIVALHQANLTANYSVLRDLGDSQFQAAYSQAALADMFRGFRERAVNLEPAVLFDASLEAQPRLTTDGLLRVVGFFPTQPQQIIFDMTFRNEGGIWRIDAINAGTRPAPQDVASLPMPPPGQQAKTPAAQAEQPVAQGSPLDLLLPFPPELAAKPQGVVDVSGQNTN